ncbi:MAG TPA: hypothetical protein VNF74_01660 [Terriglobales bacterium]|nr:hypothetical protein [Terriglobales bacterium]
MTAMDLSYRYAGGLDDQQIRALSRLSDIYGIRALRVDEQAKVIAIEYDATRLDVARVAALVRDCGVAAISA